MINTEKSLLDVKSDFPGKDSYYRLLANQNINWRDLLTMVREEMF